MAMHIELSVKFLSALPITRALEKLWGIAQASHPLIIILALIGLAVVGIFSFNLAKIFIANYGYDLLFIPAVLFGPMAAWLMYRTAYQDYNDITEWLFLVGATIVNLVLIMVLADARKQIKNGENVTQRVLLYLFSIMGLITTSLVFQMETGVNPLAFMIELITASLEWMIYFMGVR